jgi:hypothetical protein
MHKGNPFSSCHTPAIQGKGQVRLMTKISSRKSQEMLDIFNYQPAIP